MTALPLLSSPAASAFLNAFQPRPEMGNISFPAIPVPSAVASSFEISSRGLTRETVTEFQNVVGHIMQGVGRLIEESDAGCPCPLAASGGEWTIGEFADMGISDFANLTRADGRFLFIYRSEDQIQAAVGRQTDHVVYLLSSECDLKEGRVSTTFHFGFFSDGVTRLRAALRMDEAPLSEVALALAAQVYDSGQYSLETLRRRTRIYDSANKHPPLESLDELRNIPPTALTKIGLVFGAEAVILPGVLIPQALAEGKEYLDLCLQDDDKKANGELMPLHPGLRESLWDLAEVLAGSPLLVFDRN